MPDAATMDPGTAAGTQNVNVSAGPTTPLPDPTSAPVTSQIQPNPQAPVAAPASTMPAQQYKDPGFGAKVYHGILSALGGSNDIQLSRGADGKMVATAVKSGPGQQWKRIISGAITGMAAATNSGATVGPGNMGRSLGAGITGGMQQAQQQKKQATDAANEDYDEQQKTVLQKAQLAVMNQNLAAGALRMAREQADANYSDAAHANDFVKFTLDNGGKDLGTAGHFSDVLDMHKNDPSIMKAQSEGRIVSTPVYDNGKYQGVHFVMMPAEPMNQMTTEDTPIRHMIPGKKPGDPPTVETQTIPAGSMSVGNTLKAKMAGEAEVMAADNTLHTQKLQDAKERDEHLKAVASVGRDWAETRKLNADARAAQQQGGDDIESQAQALVNHDQAVSQMSKRGKTYNAILARAQEISMQKTGKAFSAEDNEAQYRVKQGILKEYSTGDAAQVIVSFDKFLGHALGASQSVNDLRNTNSPWMNVPMNKLAVGSGSKNSPAVISFLAQAETVRTEFESVLKNNRALTVEDKKSGEAILDHNSSPAQLQAALKTMAHVAAVRLRSSNFGFQRVMHRNVPDLISPEGAQSLQHFGIDPQSVYGQAGQSQAPPAAIPAGATSEVHDAKLNLIGHGVNGKFVPIGQP